MIIRRMWRCLFVLLTACLCVLPTSATAQTSPGQGWDPSPCPASWRPGPFRGALIVGSFTEFHGYLFNVEWDKNQPSNPEAAFGVYHPRGNAAPVEFIRQRVAWEDARLTLTCWRKTITRPSGPTSYVLTEVIEHKAGRLVDLEGWGGGGEEECGSEDNTAYDPYAPSGTEPCLGEGGGGGGGGGIGNESKIDLSCTVEYIVIEISYDNGQTWQVWWEGEATVCE